MTFGNNSPLHNVQLLPQPAPESVLVTNAPPNKIKNIPIVETTDNHLIVLNIRITSLYIKIMDDIKICSLLIIIAYRSEEHTSELQSRFDIVCRLLLEK